MLCRLCSSDSSVEYLQIFDNKGIEMQIAEIISQHFWFKPSQDDLFSKIICTSCWHKLDSFHQYYLSIVIAQTQLRKLQMKENVIDIQENEWILEISPDILKATNIKEENGLVYEIDKELDKDFEPDEKSNDDDDDDNDYVPKTNTKKISITMRQKPKQTVKKDPSDDSKMKTKFYIQQKRIEEEDEEISKLIKFNCDICCETFKAFSSLKYHIKRDHRRSGYVMCCNKKIFKRFLLLDHYKIHLNPEAFTCIYCEKIFADRVCLMNHLHLKHPDMDNSNTYKCEHCPRKFLTQELYEEHKKSRHKKLECKQCDKTFFSQAYLKYHERRVHEKAYEKVCDICAKRVPSESLLKIHMLEHSGESMPKFKCKECGSLLKNKHTLKLHMRKHKEALMNLKCNVCGKNVPSIQALRSHIKHVHERVNSFKCNLCPKAFNRPLTLKEHMTTHTGGALYSCAFCSKTFNSNANMYSHRKKVHLQEWLQSKSI